jgi:hyperosmotically inducible periplasmic protein
MVCVACTAQQRQQTQTQAKQASLVHGARDTSADAALVVRVSAAIAAQSGINALHVAPSVHDGAVILKGTVSSAALDRVIVDAARGVQGVRTVTDQIVVKH